MRIVSRQAVSAEQLEELRSRLDDLASRPAGDPDLSKRVERIAERLDAVPSAEQLDALRAALDELSSRPAGDPSLAEKLDALSKRLDSAVSTEQLQKLRSRLDELASRPAGDPDLSKRVERIAERLDAVPSAEQLDSLRAALDELSSRPAGDPSLAEKLDALSKRLDSAVSTEQLQKLRSRLDDLASQPTADPELSQRVERIAEQLDDLSSRDASKSLAELRAQVEALAARPAGDPSVPDRLDELAKRLDAASPPEQLQELRNRLDDLASRPTGDPELAKRIERVANRIDELSDRPAGDPALADRLDELAGRLDELAARIDSPAQDISQIHARIEELASRPSGDPELANRVEQLGRRLDDLGDRTSDHGERRARGGALEAARRRVRQDAEASEAARARRPACRPNVGIAGGHRRASLPHRRAGEQGRRAHRWPRHGDFDAIADELRRSIERLGARVDAVEEVAAERSAVDYEPRFDALESKLAETSEHGAAIAESLELLSGRVSAVDELRSRLDDLNERVVEREGADESARRKIVKKSDLAELRGDLEKGLDAIGGRVDSIATEAETTAGSMQGKLEEIAASMREDLAERQTGMDERVASAERDATALRDQLERLRAAADAADAERKDAEDDLGRRVEELSKQLSERVAEPQTYDGPALDEVRSGLASLVERLDRSDATTSQTLAKLTADLETVAQSGIDLLAHVEHAGTADASGLGDRIENLERRLDADAARSDEQVRATEEALRDGLAALGGRLAETQSSYVEAGDALRRSIERLGAAIVEADSVAGAHPPSPEVTREPEPETDGPAPFLAFVPNDSGYGLQELDGSVPAVGDALSMQNEDDFVVIRVGRSPLPLDRRRCVYLERRTMPPPATDRVP